MENTFAVDWATQPAPKSKEELQEALTQMFAEMDRMNARMEQNRVEIDRLGNRQERRLTTFLA